MVVQSLSMWKRFMYIHVNMFGGIIGPPNEKVIVVRASDILFMLKLEYPVCHLSVLRVVHVFECIRSEQWPRGLFYWPRHRP